MAKKYFTLVLFVVMGLGTMAMGQGVDTSPAQNGCRCYVGASLMWGGGGTDVNMDPVAVGSYGALPDMPASTPDMPSLSSGDGILSNIGGDGVTTMQGNVNTTANFTGMPGGAGMPYQMGQSIFNSTAGMVGTIMQRATGVAGLVVGGGAGAAMFAFGFPEVTHALDSYSPLQAMQQGLIDPRFKPYGAYAGLVQDAESLAIRKLGASPLDVTALRRSKSPVDTRLNEMFAEFSNISANRNYYQVARGAEAADVTGAVERNMHDAAGRLRLIMEELEELPDIPID